METVVIRLHACVSGSPSSSSEFELDQPAIAALIIQPYDGEIVNA